MQSSSHELSTPVTDSVYVNIHLKNSFADTENDVISGVSYPTDVKSAGFLFQLEACRVSSHTDEL